MTKRNEPNRAGPSLKEPSHEEREQLGSFVALPQMPKTNQMTNLKWRNNHESFKHASAKPRKNPPRVTELPRLRILQRRLKHRIGPHPQRVLQRQVRRERCQPLPQRPHALRAGHGGAAVDDPLVRAGPVQLQPGLDDVDGLQAAGLHGSSDRARYGLHVGRDGLVGFLLVFLVGH